MSHFRWRSAAWNRTQQLLALDRMRRTPRLMPDFDPLPPASEPPRMSDDLPKIQPRQSMWFRVMRMVRPAGKPEEFSWECIRECPTESEAVLVASLQKYRCVVTDWHSKRKFDNAQPPKDIP